MAVKDGGTNLDDGGLPDVNYNIVDWSDITNGEGFDWIYEYEKEERNIYVPLSEGEMGPRQMTDRYLLYHFDGKRFVKKGEVGHRGIHPSVQQYKRLLCFFKTKDYVIRVDQMADGALRYASWKSNMSLSEKPDLVIMGGRMIKEDNYSHSEDIYLFTNEGVEYQIGRGEIHLDPEGDNDYDQYLIVSRNGKQILKQERI